jgi:cyanobactin maturation PatA/PatG family protease
MLAHFGRNPWSAASVIWTLNLDATPIYAIQPSGPFAAEAYERLRRFLNEQLTEGVEMVCIPGWIKGSSRLLSGQPIPMIQPEVSGMASWTTSALVEAAVGALPPKDAAEREKQTYAQRSEGVRNFLQRIYHEVRNLGLISQDRALNFVATNALMVAKIFESALKNGMDLDTISVERSPICRPDSDCWDVKLTFFNPAKLLEQARKVYRFTVDVSDVVPVVLGPHRSWFVR